MLIEHGDDRVINYKAIICTLMDFLVVFAVIRAYFKTKEVDEYLVDLDDLWHNSRDKPETIL